MALFAITTIDRDDPGRLPGSTAVTFRSGAGAQDANVFIPHVVAYRHSTQGHQLAPRLKQNPELDCERVRVPAYAGTSLSFSTYAFMRNFHAW
jgi:hypothetical protein